jgi:hypothetical protein
MNLYNQVALFHSAHVRFTQSAQLSSRYFFLVITVLTCTVLFSRTAYAIALAEHYGTKSALFLWRKALNAVTHIANTYKELTILFSNKEKTPLKLSYLQNEPIKHLRLNIRNELTGLFVKLTTTFKYSIYGFSTLSIIILKRKIHEH